MRIRPQFSIKFLLALTLVVALLCAFRNSFMPFVKLETRFVCGGGETTYLWKCGLGMTVSRQPGKWPAVSFDSVDFEEDYDLDEEDLAELGA
jgi:hypothetical protein